MEDDPFLQPLTKADELLMSVYGDTIHLNDGCQLDGGIEDNKLWLRRWLRVVACDLKLWEVPRRCNLGKRFVNLLANEFKGVRLRQWNSERVIVFAAVILNRRSNVKEAKEIKKVIQQRLDMWEAGQFTALCNEVMKGAESVAPFCTAGDWKEDGVSENVAARYNSMVLSGKIRSAVRFATERGQGGPYSPDDACSKTGRPVIDVLRDTSTRRSTFRTRMRMGRCLALRNIPTAGLELPILQVVKRSAMSVRNFMVLQGLAGSMRSSFNHGS